MRLDITIGQYFPGVSPIHRLDPRTKILLMLLYIVQVFLVKSIWVYSLCALLVAGVTLLAQVPISYLFQALRPIRFLLIVMFLLNLFFTPSGDVLWTFWKLTLTDEGIVQAIYLVLRLALLVCGTSLLTLTTSPLALTDGLERLLSPLAALKFPAHELAMMMTIALRFIPTLLEEADRITKAQLARGAQLDSGNLFQRVKSMVPILVPLFVSAFRRADELAMAMESRCYHGGRGRTRMRVLRLGRNDVVAALVMAGLLAAILVANP